MLLPHLLLVLGTFVAARFFTVLRDERDVVAVFKVSDDVEAELSQLQNEPTGPHNFSLLYQKSVRALF